MALGSDERIADRLASLTLQEKCRLLGGASTWRTHAIPRLGVPAIKMSDGPNGVRGESLGATRTPGLSIPTSIVVGASWDVDLAHQLGLLLGREAFWHGLALIIQQGRKGAGHDTQGKVF